MRKVTGWWLAVPLAALAGAGCGDGAGAGEPVTSPALRTLAAAVGGHRFTEPRLTPFSGFAPCTLRGGPDDLVPEAGCTPLPDGELGPLLVQTSSRIQEESADLPPAVTFHATGILSLLDDGDPAGLRKAIAALEEARSRDPRDARILNDLAVAYNLRAHRNERPWDLVLALSALEQAIRSDPELLPARFNRALFLQKLSMRHGARRAWTEYLAADIDSPWADEARRHWLELAAASRDTRREIEDALRRATRGAPGELDRLVRGSRQTARLLAEELLLGAWAQSVQEGRFPEAQESLRQARVLGDSLARVTGDWMVRDCVAAIDREVGSAPGTGHLAAGHWIYANALELMASRHFAEAEPLLRDALRHLDGRSPFALWVRFALMRCAFQGWRHEEALAIGQGILDDAPWDRYPTIAGRALWVQATTSMSLGRSDDAIGAYRQAAERFERTGETESQATVRGHLGTALDYLGAPTEAWDERYRALKLYAGRGDNRQLRLLLTAAASSALENGQPDAAAAMLDEVVALAAEAHDPLELATALLHRARHRRSTGAVEKARTDLARAQDLSGSVDQTLDRESLRGEILLEEGRLERDSDPAAAVAHLTEAEKVFIANDYPLHLPRLYYERARAHLRQGDDPVAERDLGLALDALEEQRAGAGESTRRVSFLDRMNDIPEEMVAFQADRRKRDLALDFSEASRGRVLLDWLAQLSPSGRLEASDRAAGRPRPSRELLLSLPDGTVFLQYEVIRDRLLIWVIGPDDLSLEQVPVTAADLESKVRRFHRLRPGGGQGFRSAAADLFEILIRPVRRHLPPNAHLVVSPDEILHEVPFAALVDPASGRYLIEDAQISAAPSLNAYLGEAAACAGRRDFRMAHLLIVADPRIDSSLAGILDPLRGAEEEGRAIAQIYPGARVLSKEDATRTRVTQELPEAEVLHFAGHSLANPRAPLLSSLVLAPEAGLTGSGTWSAREILAQSFPETRLVVLASCRSAGSPSETEGILGLAWPFLARGVPFVIASLWKVDDRTTARLFPRFYEGLRQGLDPEAALRRAQLVVLASTGNQGSASTLDWAAFQVFAAGQARCRP